MVQRSFFILWFLAGALSCFADEEQVITVDDLKRSKVIGGLGVPLGTVTKIEAVIVSGDATRRKANGGRYLLKVIQVAGKVLEKAPVMDFGPLRTGDPQIATTHFELYELKHGKKVKRLDSAEIRKLEEGYVGKKMTLMVYESGRFGGVPTGLPVGEVWQGAGFGFTTSLTVVEIERE